MTSPPTGQQPRANAPIRCSDATLIRPCDGWLQFARDEAVHVPVIGADNYTGLKHFYSTVAKLFAAGNLGGARIFAHKPLGW